VNDGVENQHLSAALPAWQRNINAARRCNYRASQAARATVRSARSIICATTLGRV